MAINNINGIPGPQTSRTGEGAKAQQARNDAVSQRRQEQGAVNSDSVSLTDTAAKLRSIEGVLSGMPDVDNERVATIQRAIADGSYQIDAGRIADKLLNFEADFSK